MHSPSSHDATIHRGIECLRKHNMVDIEIKGKTNGWYCKIYLITWRDAVRTVLWIPQHKPTSHDAVRTRTVLHSTIQTDIECVRLHKHNMVDIEINCKIIGWYCKIYITWCNAHSSFGFHNTHHHQVIQFAQQFFIPQHTPPSRDAVHTTIFHSTTHTTIKWCSAHNTFLFHITHHHHVMQCTQ